MSYGEGKRTLGLAFWISLTVVSSIGGVVGAAITQKAISAPAPPRWMTLVESKGTFCTLNGRWWFPSRSDEKCYAADAPKEETCK